MRIIVERSGGLAGIPISTEMDEKEMPSALIRTAKKIMKNTRSFSLPMNSTPRGAADHYVYKISITDGENQRTIKCDQYNIQDDLKSLIKQLEKFSKKKLK